MVKRGKKERIDDQRETRDLLIMLLLASGIEAKTIAKVLGIVPRAITNKFPVSEIQKQSKAMWQTSPSSASIPPTAASSG